MFCNQIATAQNTTIEYIYNEKNVSMPVAILFSDTILSKTDTFDIIGSNPFNNFDFDVIHKDFWGWNTYKLTKPEFDIIIPKNLRSKYLPEAEIISSQEKYFIGDVSLSGGFDNPSSNIVLAYTFMVYDEFGEMYVGATAYYYVLNRKGKIEHISKSLGVNVNSICITEDNEFVGFDYGGAMNNEYIHEGVRIYNSNNDSLILDMPIKEAIIVGFIGTKLIVTEYDYDIGKPGKHCIYFLDAKSGEIGKYIYPSREAWLNSGNMWKDSHGLYFKNIRGEELELLFERDFIKTYEK